MAIWMHTHMRWRDVMFRIAADEHGVRALLPGDARASLADMHARFPNRRFQEGLHDSFKGTLAHLENPESPPPPLAPEGTHFQQMVWTALLGVPVGRTMSYSAIAAQIGHPKAARAVAAACAANPIAILIPCHRVIRSDGSISGYRWGVEMKKELLASELRIHSARGAGSTPASINPSA